MPGKIHHRRLCGVTSKPPSNPCSLLITYLNDMLAEWQCSWRDSVVMSKAHAGRKVICCFGVLSLCCCSVSISLLSLHSLSYSKWISGRVSVHHMFCFFSVCHWRFNRRWSQLRILGRFLIFHYYYDSVVIYLFKHALCMIILCCCGWVRCMTFRQAHTQSDKIADLHIVLVTFSVQKPQFGPY